MPPKTNVSVEEFMDSIEVIIREIAALRADIKALKMNMLQINQLKQTGGNRV